MKVYNVGISGHSFAKCASHLEAAIKKYRPSKFIIIETQVVKFIDSEIMNIINNKIPKHPAYDKGILSLLGRVTFFRLIYRQCMDYLKSASERENISEFAYNTNLLAQMLKLLYDTTEICNAKLIIAYHPPVSLNKDGTLKIDNDADSVKLFSDSCKRNGVYFLDMSERFLSEYAKNYTLPYGFINSSVGKGHMNRYGHKMFAEEIYALMKRIEAKS